MGPAGRIQRIAALWAPIWSRPAPGMAHISAQLTLSTTPCGEYSAHLHFIDEETGQRNFVGDSTVTRVRAGI